MFNSNEEANISLETAQKEMKNKICPLLKMECIGTKCASLFTGNVKSHIDTYSKKRTFEVTQPSCNSPIVTGILVVEH